MLYGSESVDLSEFWLSDELFERLRPLRAKLTSASVLTSGDKRRKADQSQESPISDLAPRWPLGPRPPIPIADMPRCLMLVYRRSSGVGSLRADRAATLGHDPDQTVTPQDGRWFIAQTAACVRLPTLILRNTDLR